MRSRFIRPLILSLAILCVGVFLFVSVRPGHDWGDDFAQYILLAGNIANGRPYQDTGYIVNPDHLSIGPSAYPPIFPLILAPVYAGFGLDLMAFKYVICFFLIATLLVLFLLFRNTHDFFSRIAAILLLGLNPVVVETKNLILSDIPFLFFLFASLWAVEWIAARNKPAWWQLGLAGILVYLCAGLRTIGVVVIPAILLAEWWKTRQIPWKGIGISTSALILLVIQSWIIPSTSNYLDMFSINPALWGKFFLSYLAAFVMFWQVEWGAVAWGILLSILVVSFGVGFWESIKRKPSTVEFFFGGYFLAVVIWPYFQGVRFMLPLLFLSVIYILKGVQVISQRFRQKILRNGLATVVLVLSLSGYISVYQHGNFEPLTYGVEHPDSIALFAYIQEHTPKDAVVVFFKPRALALFGERRSTGFKVYEDDRQFWSWMDTCQADFLIGELIEDEYNWKDGKLNYYAENFARRYPEQFHLVFQNPSFHVYEIRFVRP